MPSTCEERGGVSKSVAHTAFVPSAASAASAANKHSHCTRLPNVILCFSHESYNKVLHGIVTQSLDSVLATFNTPQVAREIDRLRAIVADASHGTLCAVFFLLLNVDANLKEMIVAMDSDANQHKMARFLTDLRNVLAVRFFTNERCTPMIYVEECVDCYLLS